MKVVGIDIGTTKSCIGYEEAGDLKIIQNALGDEIVPSIVSITDKVVAGVDALNYKTSNFDSTISEVKRIIGIDNLKKNCKFQNYIKHLSYELIEEENKPLLIKTKEKEYTPELIYAYLIKKVKENARNNGVSFRKAIFTVPACFGITKRLLIKKAVELAGFKESNIQIINGTSAAAIAYAIYNNKSSQNSIFDYNFNIFPSSNNNKSSEDLDSSPISLNINSKKTIVIFDLGGGCFDLTLLSIEEKDDFLEFNIKANLGDCNLGGIDFDNKLVDFCIKEFCNKTKINEDRIYMDKKAIKRLKIKCELAKKLLDIKEKVVINVENFFENEDLSVVISIVIYNSICEELYKRIKYKLNKLLKLANKENVNINEVLSIGEASKIPRVKLILRDIFKKTKIVDNIDKDKIVTYGAIIYACEMKKIKLKKNIILNELIPYSLGISVANNDGRTFIKYGDKMYKIIEQINVNSLPFSIKKQFNSKITKNKILELNFYEGNNKYVKYNKKIGELKIEIEEAEVGSLINYDITFELDVNLILKIKVEIPSLKITKDIEIKKSDTIEEVPLELDSNEINSECPKIKEDLKQYSSNIENFKGEDKNRALINCCNCCDDLLNEYKKIYNYKEDVIENIYNIIKKLFTYYLERLKIKNKKENDNEKIILEIDEKIKYIIDYVEYLENLLDIFKDIYNEDKAIFFEIIINYMNIMNKEGVNKLKKKNKTKKYLSKMYFESCANIIKKYKSELNSSDINYELKLKYITQEKINEYAIELVNISEKQNKSIDSRKLTSFIDSIKNKGYIWLKDTCELIDELSNNSGIYNMNK